MDLRRRHAGTAGIKPGMLHAVALKYGDGRRRPFEAARVHPRGSDHGLTRASTSTERAAVTPPARSMGQEQRHGRPREHALGGPAKNELPYPGMPVRAHDQKIGTAIRHMG